MKTVIQHFTVDTRFRTKNQRLKDRCEGGADERLQGSFDRLPHADIFTDVEELLAYRLHQVPDLPQRPLVALRPSA